MSSTRKPRRRDARTKTTTGMLHKVGVEGRRTGIKPKANVLKDKDDLDNVDDFFASSDEEEELEVASAAAHTDAAPSPHRELATNDYYEDDNDARDDAADDQGDRIESSDMSMAHESSLAFVDESCAIADDVGLSPAGSSPAVMLLGSAARSAARYASRVPSSLSRMSRGSPPADGGATSPSADSDPATPLSSRSTPHAADMIASTPLASVTDEDFASPLQLELGGSSPAPESLGVARRHGRSPLPASESPAPRKKPAAPRGLKRLKMLGTPNLPPTPEPNYYDPDDQDYTYHSDDDEEDADDDEEVSSFLGPESDDNVDEDDDDDSQRKRSRKRTRDEAATPLVRVDLDSKRPKRTTRIRPLDYWKNEGVVYGKRDSVGFATIVDVIRKPIEDEPAPKRRKRTYNDSQPPIPPTNVYDAKSRKHVERQVACNLGMASFHSLRPALPSDATDCSSITNPRIGGAKGESLVQSAVMFEHEHFVSGTVVLAPGAASGPQRTLTQTELFAVVSGRLEVMLNDTKINLVAGGQLVVPPKNAFQFTNLSRADRCVITFFRVG